MQLYTRTASLPHATKRKTKKKRKKKLTGAASPSSSGVTRKKKVRDKGILTGLNGGYWQKLRGESLEKGAKSLRNTIPPPPSSPSTSSRRGEKKGGHQQDEDEEEDDADNPSFYSTPDLRRKLRQRGLDPEGTRTQLRLRLQEWQSAQAKKNEEDSNHMFRLYVDASTSGNIGRFLNHR